MGCKPCKSARVGVVRNSFLPGPPKEKEGCERFKHEWVTSKAEDKMRIYCGIWDAKKAEERKAVIIYAHGFGNHVHDGNYDRNLIEPLSDEGYVVYGFDKRGHGRTGKAAVASGNIGSVAERQGDYVAVIEAAHLLHPTLPIFLLGSSFGGVDTVNIASKHEDYTDSKFVKGIMLLSPGASELLIGSGSEAVKALSARVCPSRTVPAALEAELVQEETSDIGISLAECESLLLKCNSNKVGFLSQEELADALNGDMKLDLSAQDLGDAIEAFDVTGEKKVSIDDLVAAVAATHRAEKDVYALKQKETSEETAGGLKEAREAFTEEAGAKIVVPVLWLHGEVDGVNSIQDADKVVQATPSEDKTCKITTSLRHGVFMDKDAVHVQRDIFGWLKTQMDAIAISTPVVEKEDPEVTKPPVTPVTVIDLTNQALDEKQPLLEAGNEEGKEERPAA